MIMSNEERSLGDVLPADAQTPQEASIADTSVEPTPENFDMDAWLSGVRPVRRSVKLYPKGDLVARMEEIAVEIDNTPEGVNVDHLVDEFEQIKAQFYEGVWFTVEKRSTDWIKKFRKDLSKRLNLDPDKKDEDATIVVLHQIAAQIVSPPGITYNQLWQLQQTNEGELNKLAAVMTAANESLAERAGVLTRDFSERRSDTTQD